MLGLEIDGTHTLAMPPYLDMLNHSLTPNIDYYYNDATKCFYMKATKDIPFGDICWLTYGHKTNL